MKSNLEPAIPPGVPAASLSYLESRLREEADAAATASSVEETLAHLRLATAYARRLGECSGRSTAESWAGEHRVW